MKNFRAIIGLRQAADDYFKGINNTIDRLYQQGLSEYAHANVEQMKAYGFTTYFDENGLEKISRNNANKELYKSMSEETTEEIKKSDLYNVKEAKFDKWRREVEEAEQEEAEDQDDYDDYEEAEDQEYNKLYSDKFDLTSDWYELAKLLVSEYNTIAEKAAPIDITTAMQYLHMGHGGRGDLDQYRDIARNTLDYLRDFEGEFDDSL